MEILPREDSKSKKTSYGLSLCLFSLFCGVFQLFSFALNATLLSREISPLSRIYDLIINMNRDRTHLPPRPPPDISSLVTVDYSQ